MLRTFQNSVSNLVDLKRNETKRDVSLRGTYERAYKHNYYLAVTHVLLGEKGPRYKWKLMY